VTITGRRTNAIPSQKATKIRRCPIQQAASPVKQVKSFPTWSATQRKSIIPIHQGNKQPTVTSQTRHSRAFVGRTQRTTRHRAPSKKSSSAQNRKHRLKYRGLGNQRHSIHKTSRIAPQKRPFQKQPNLIRYLRGAFGNHTTANTSPPTTRKQSDTIGCHADEPHRNSKSTDRVRRHTNKELPKPLSIPCTDIPPTD